MRYGQLVKQQFPIYVFMFEYIKRMQNMMEREEKTKTKVNTEQLFGILFYDRGMSF